MKEKKEKGKIIVSPRRIVKIGEIRIDKIVKIGVEIEIFNINQKIKKETEIGIEIGIENENEERKKKKNNVKNKDKRSNLRKLVGIKTRAKSKKKREGRNHSMILLIVLMILLIPLVHSNLMIEKENMRRKEGILKVKINAERIKKKIKFVIRGRSRKKTRIKIDKRISTKQRR
jgi:hypothetical protein